jgi:hypothetical protein
MPPKTLTPPPEHHGLGSDGSSTLWSESDSQDQPTPATPISNINMGMDGMEEERSNMDERPASLSSSDNDDDDADMSDGGAAIASSEMGEPLTMTLSHAEQLNAEMDMLDVELMGEEILHDMYQDSHYHSMDDPVIFSPADLHSQLHHAGFPVSSLPTADDISMQLQHLQDLAGEDNMDAQEDMQEGANFESTLLPFLHTPSPPSIASNLNEALAMVQQLSITQEPFSFTHAGIFLYILPSATAQDENLADNDQVEDQTHNLSLADFLYSWGRSATRCE